MTRVVGVLLAAGRARRFGGDKLGVHLQSGADAGVPIGVAACRRLSMAVDSVIAVVRADDQALAPALQSEGAECVVAQRADEGMGASLAAGIAGATDASGYVIALADMPFIQVSTIARVVDALHAGASIVAPLYRGRRGHPVGFASAHRDALLALRGDEGANALLVANDSAVELIDVDDPGVLRDVDVPEDLD